MTSYTLIRKFWSHVFQNPEGKSVVMKNPFADSTPIFIGGHPMVGAHVIMPPQYTHIDWERAGMAVASIMAFLRKNGFKKGDRAAILGWNSPEWVWADLAIQSMGGVTVPIYPHSAAEQVNYVLENSGALFTFSNEDEQIAKVAVGKAVHFDTIPSALWSGLPKRPFTRWFIGRSAERADNADNWPGVATELAYLKTQLHKPNFCGVSMDDLATIIYTSGSTGVPKGGMLTHGNIASACESLMAHGFEQDPENDLYLSFLPLAHVYERVDGMALALWNACPVVFCKVDEVGHALKTHAPSILLGVPAVWRKIKDNIEAKLKEATGLKKSLVDWAFQQKEPGFKHFLADLLVFRKIRGELGGNLRVMLSGGAPISPDVIAFFNQIGLELLQGYGLTETAGGITTNRPSSLKGARGPVNKVGAVGQVVPGCKVRIVPEPGQENSGQGEILLSGPLVFKGYWKMPEETAKTFSPDGWFKTGDLGRVDEDGFLFITGRKKRLLKTEGGKYVAPEKIEKAFEPYPIVQYVVPVGDGLKYISALVFVNQAIARTLVGEVPAGADAAAFIAAHPAVVKAVDEAVNAVNGKLERWETLKKYKIVPVEAQVANGLLTPTLKIRSEEAGKRFKAEVEALYK
jgi:long-chain acyl-CoA synthetase